ncbi:MAG: hypothetical protein A2735_02655 [Candidatus Yanofskybacteria bacterium RIFCSPHIGHO2_01_FULL_41_21]|uniref:Uncharacterized protein n=1 Tax=Candidatus Yanofskybacteria bacterium RIFCSPHIGHO2_01_FULL_41_21 TaxID=1802660 RepID=A0A1F8E9I3_9BACT|nr:MAG: hypothetical protein A2735_02655 [Candidatus Yanofskybacteria bacterium RIFCSPHIGHO2_01_FULL_41_21]
MDINSITETIKSSGLVQADKDFLMGILNDSSKTPEQKSTAISEFINKKIPELEQQIGNAQTGVVEEAQKQLENLDKELGESLSKLDTELKG